MLATPGTEPVAETQKLRLVNRRQEHDHRHLDDLVLDGRDAERPFFTVGLRDVDPTRRQRSIRSPVQAAMEVTEPRLKIPQVVRPRLVIDARSGILS